MRFSFKAALLTLALFLNPSTGWTDDRFDVSYLWHQKHAAVEAYRIRVLGVLGPASASRLKVVKRKNLFGLVYACWRYCKHQTGGQVHTELLVETLSRQHQHRARLESCDTKRFVVRYSGTYHRPSRVARQTGKPLRL